MVSTLHTDRCVSPELNGVVLFREAVVNILLLGEVAVPDDDFHVVSIAGTLLQELTRLMLEIPPEGDELCGGKNENGSRISLMYVSQKKTAGILYFYQLQLSANLRNLSKKTDNKREMKSLISHIYSVLP